MKDLSRGIAVKTVHHQTAFTNDWLEVAVAVVRVLKTLRKLKIKVVSRVVSLTESCLE